MLRSLVLMICICGGGAIGWKIGTPGELMTSYLTSFVGSAAGLYIGRRLQHNFEL